jgi:predicted enzyme related to lactoylglutathione lyase
MHGMPSTSAFPSPTAVSCSLPQGIAPTIVVAFFPQAAGYFPVTQPAMLNFQVDDLDGLLDQLIAAGVSVDPKRDSAEYGKFGWFADPEGNRVELWQPPAA